MNDALISRYPDATWVVGGLSHTTPDSRFSTVVSSYFLTRDSILSTCHSTCQPNQEPLSVSNECSGNISQSADIYSLHSWVNTRCNHTRSASNPATPDPHQYEQPIWNCGTGPGPRIAAVMKHVTTFMLHSEVTMYNAPTFSSLNMPIKADYWLIHP